MATTGIVSVELAVHVHATESYDKVKQALLSLIPDSARGDVVFDEQVLEGHYGNPITRIVARIRGARAREVLEHIASRLGDVDKKLLKTMLENRYDSRSGRLYLRVSKQDAYLGHVRLLDSDDVIKITIVLRGSPRLEEVLGILQELGLVA